MSKHHPGDPLFREGQRCVLAKWTGKDERRPTPVEVVEVLNIGHWDAGGWLSPLYLVRELSTGVTYPAAHEDLRPYRDAAAHGLKLTERQRRSLEAK